MEAGVLTCILLHIMCDLKVTQMNLQHSLIQELMLYLFRVIILQEQQKTFVVQKAKT